MAALKDRYICVLQYAESKSEFTLPELVKALGLTDIQESQLALQIHEKQIFQTSSGNYINSYKNQEIKLHLSVDDKFKLLNYVALEEARSSSRRATGYAVSALVISIVASIASGYLSIKQLNSDINIPNYFTMEINKIAKTLDDIHEHLTKSNQSLDAQKLNELIKNQAVTNAHLSEVRETFSESRIIQERHDLRK